jgi:hypothetical protein
VCDCGKEKNCEHAFAAKLELAAARLAEDPVRESTLKCRYCGSPDVERAGFRYNAHGMARRFRCNECLRKFSVKFTDIAQAAQPPSETIWLIAEIGQVLTKLEDMMERLALSLGQGRTIDASKPSEPTGRFC